MVSCSRKEIKWFQWRKKAATHCSTNDVLADEAQHITTILRCLVYHNNLSNGRLKIIRVKLTKVWLCCVVPIFRFSLAVSWWMKDDLYDSVLEIRRWIQLCCNFYARLTLVYSLHIIIVCFFDTTSYIIANQIVLTLKFKRKIFSLLCPWVVFPKCKTVLCLYFYQLLFWV